MNYGELRSTPRLLFEADLEPQQGHRFQPTGFPNLGPATYDIPNRDASGKKTSALLVESVQSMANRLETVCLDDSRQQLAGPLAGMPFVRVEMDGEPVTNTLLESHRLSSAYIRNGKMGGATLPDDMNKALQAGADKKVDLEILLGRLHKYLFERDPNSLLHGIWFADKKISEGRLRLARALSSFIEATGVSEVPSGGAKIDRVNPGKEDDKTAESGYGNVPFPRVEYTAEKITAYFSLDAAQIGRYKIGESHKDFLICLGLWKIRRLLDGDLRLRTACDLCCKGIRGTSCPLPEAGELDEDVKGLIQKCGFEREPLTVTHSK